MCVAVVARGYGRAAVVLRLWSFATVHGRARLSGPVILTMAQASDVLTLVVLYIRDPDDCGPRGRRRLWSSASVVARGCLR